MIIQSPHFRIGILGASGYSGGQLLRLLLRHTGVAVGPLFANSSVGADVATLHPDLRGRVDAKFEPWNLEKASSCNLIFLALPSGEALPLLPLLAERGVKVIDLGGDFRLKDAAAYQQFYRRAHTATEYLSKAVYGLPEWNAGEIAAAEVIANPGCYPTSVLLPLLPLVAAGVIDLDCIIIHSMSGTTGAGRSASAELSFSEVAGNVRAYRVGDHQHLPEIEQALGRVAGTEVTVTFTPHLIPVERGIVTTMTLGLRRPITHQQLDELYHQHYSNKPFVRWSPERIPDLRGVVGTNFIDIGYRLDPRTGRLTLMSAIDNLLKGAAGQAVQNMNIQLGFDETEGLL